MLTVNLYTCISGQLIQNGNGEIMKFGEMQYDVPFEKLGSKTGRWDFNFFENFSIKQEGKRLYRLHPEYSYLKEDPQLKSDDDFYRSVVFAYMVDFVRCNDPGYIKYSEEKYEYKNNKHHKAINETKLNRYRDYLREQADPGCLEREHQKEEEELQKSIELHAAMAKMDAERHPHVECPYCHSTNTEKISVASRAVSISLVGAASGKIGKQWHCRQCGSDF